MEQSKLHRTVSESTKSQLRVTMPHDINDFTYMVSFIKSTPSVKKAVAFIMFHVYGMSVKDITAFMGENNMGHTFNRISDAAMHFDVRDKKMGDAFDTITKMALAHKAERLMIDRSQNVKEWIGNLYSPSIAGVCCLYVSTGMSVSAASDVFGIPKSDIINHYQKLSEDATQDRKEKKDKRVEPEFGC